MLPISRLLYLHTRDSDRNNLQGVHFAVATEVREGVGASVKMAKAGRQDEAED